MRAIFWKLGLLALLTGGFAVRAAQTPSPWTVDAVVEQMDRAAANFRTLTADLEHSKYTDVVKDTSVETGRIFVRRDEKMRIEIQKPHPRLILRTGETLYVFTPKIKRVEEYDLGKNRAMVDQYVLLGFGTRGDDLKNSYVLTVLGEAALDNRKTLLLELTPKSEKIRSQISKIQMWIDQASWIPLQQKFFEPGSGDYFIFHYTNVTLNAKIGDGHFKPAWPKGVTRIKPRG